jgi:hypothetical protein
VKVGRVLAFLQTANLDEIAVPAPSLHAPRFPTDAMIAAGIGQLRVRMICSMPPEPILATHVETSVVLAGAGAS